MLSFIYMAFFMKSSKMASSFLCGLLILTSITFSATVSLKAQSLYFPPLSGDEWQTVSPASLGWCVEETDSLYQFLETENSKAFILLKDGKIVLEKYFGSFTADSVWYWASAGKSLTGFTTGIAQREGFLSIEDSSSRYLGQGWTGCTPAFEDHILIRNQLSMTTGLNDAVADPDCTLASCLECIAAAGERWAYHNAPYTLMDQVISAAAGMSLNSYINSRIRVHTGITGLFIQNGYNNTFYSRPRSMARFGLLILNKGVWDQTNVLGDTAFFSAMTNTSNPFNASYGYLWWLNGKSSFMLPGVQFVFQGPLFPDAPSDVVAALGKNGQIINVAPAAKLVFIRMGNAPQEGGVITPLFSNEIWKHLNKLMCGAAAIHDNQPVKIANLLLENPVTKLLKINAFKGRDEVTFDICDLGGRSLMSASGNEIDVESLAPGAYLVSIRNKNQHYRQVFIKQ